MESANAELPPVTAVIVNWNSATLVVALLQSIESAFERGLRAVIVDNASSDDSIRDIEAFLEGWSQRDRVQLVVAPENLGFTGGVNFGTSAALMAEQPPEFIWLLNPDATTSLETLEELVAVLELSGAAIACNSSEYLRTDAWPKPFWQWKRSSHWANDRPGRWWPVGAYFGACAIFRSELVRRMIEHDGHFQDASLFMDWDEWECSLRARRLGATIVMARDTAIMHDNGFRTLGRSRRAELRQYYAARNGVAVTRRHLPAWRFWMLFPIRLARDFSWFLRVRLKGETPHPGCYLFGTFDGLRGRMGRWRQHPPDAPVGDPSRLPPPGLRTNP